MEILIKKVPSLASISKFFKPENESWLENFKSVFAKAFNSIKFFGTFSTILIFVFDKFSTVENLFTNTVELAIKITKSTNIPELKNYKFWFIEISISIHLDRISHQKYTFTTSSAIDFFYNDNFHTLGKYAIQINRNGEVILKGEAVDKGYVKVTIYGIY